MNRTRLLRSLGLKAFNMKHIKFNSLIFVIILFNFSFLYAQAEHPAVFNNYIRINNDSKKIKDAKIRKCTEIIISNNRQDTLKFQYYDNNGNLSQQFIFSEAEGDNSSRDYHNYFFLYDKDGRLVQKMDSSKNEVKRTIIDYDEFGNISKEEVKSQAMVISDISYEYDNLSRLVESTEKNSVGNCKIVEQYSYDSYNNLTRLSVKNSCDNLSNKPLVTTINYKYDQKYNIIEKRTSFPSGGYKIENFLYDPKGNLTESYESTSESSYIKYVYSYDIPSSTVNVVKTEVIGDFKTKFTQIRKYDKFGNFLEEQYLGPKSELMYTLKNIYEYYN